MLSYSKRYSDGAMKWLGIRPVNIAAAVRNKDQVDPFDLPGDVSPKPRVVLYLKNITSTKRPSYMLVLTVGREDTEEVLGAWLVPQDWVRSDPRPKQVMEALCRECGYMIVCGSRREHFIIAESFPVPPGSNHANLFGVENLEDGDTVVGSTLFMLDSKSICHVAVVYGLSKKRLIEKLKRR